MEQIISKPASLRHQFCQTCILSPPYILKVKKMAESTFEAKKIGINGDDNFLRQMYVNHENASNFVFKR